MRYKALPWLRVGTFGLGAQSANIRRRVWNARNAIIEVLVLRDPRTLSDPPGTRPCPPAGKMAAGGQGRVRDYTHSTATANI